MNDSELDKKLKAAREPVLQPEYTADFPRTVLANLRSGPRRIAQPDRSWLPRLVWSLAAAGCVLISFFVIHWDHRAEAGRDVLANSKVVEETLSMFPNRVRGIVADERGLNLVLSDTDNVPVSPPIYVRICDGAHCSSLVTFSGQEIQIAGQKITVLSDASGGIILEGDQFVWSNGPKSTPITALKIQAKFL